MEPTLSKVRVYVLAFNGSESFYETGLASTSPSLTVPWAPQSRLQLAVVTTGNRVVRAASSIHYPHASAEERLLAAACGNIGQHLRRENGGLRLDRSGNQSFECSFLTDAAGTYNLWVNASATSTCEVRGIFEVMSLSLVLLFRSL